MRGEGLVVFAAPPARTWTAITDPNLLVACREIARGLKVEVLDASRARLTGRLGSGFLTLAASADVELTEAVQGASASWAVHGTASGHVLEAVLRLDVGDGPDGGSTVRWAAEGDVSGPYAGLARSALLQEGGKVFSEALDCLRKVLAA